MLKDNVQDLDAIIDGVEGTCEHVPGRYIFTCKQPVAGMQGIFHKSDMVSADEREHEVIITLADGFSFSLAPHAWWDIQKLPDHDEGVREKQHQDDTAWFREMDEELRK